MKIPLFSKKTSSGSKKADRPSMPRHANFSLISHFAEAFNTLRTNIRSKKTSSGSKKAERPPMPRHANFSLILSHFAEAFNTLRTNIRSKKTSSGSKKVNRLPIPRHANFSLISHFAEAFNTLRTNIRFARLDNPVKVILITGASPAEGKTTVAVNLAESFAFSGQKVLIIECDLRLTTFKNLFPCDPKRGVSSLISATFDTSVENGSLGTLSMGDLMTLIDLQEKTGILTISDNSDAYKFSFEKGKLVSSVWENRPKDKRLGSVLISSNKITEEQAKKALDRAAETGQQLGFILVNMGIVTPDHLRGPIRLQIIDALSRAFNLSEAEYSFEKSSHVMYERNIIDPIVFGDILTNEVPGIRTRPFLYEQIASSTVKTDVENLHVLSSGPAPPNPSEVLGSRRMAVLMGMLKDTFDYDVLIIDSPPVTAVSDALILSAYAEGVIMVVRAGAVNRAIIHKAVDQLNQINAPILGFVLNRMNPKEEKHYYSYYYKYRDYYYKGKK